jgi:hypothetical protein
VLAACPTATTTEVGDVDGGLPGGCYRYLRQQLPPVPIRDLRGTGDEGPGAPTINVKTLTTGLREVPELKIRERSACRARPLGRAVNGCRNLGINAQKVVRTHFTLTQVGHFCTLFLGPRRVVCPLSGVGNSSRLLTHVPSSKTRPRQSDPPLTVREAPRVPTRSTDT